MRSRMTTSVDRRDEWKSNTSSRAVCSPSSTALHSLTLSVRHVREKLLLVEDDESDRRVHLVQPCPQSGKMSMNRAKETLACGSLSRSFEVNMLSRSSKTLSITDDKFANDLQCHNAKLSQNNPEYFSLQANILPKEFSPWRLSWLEMVLFSCITRKA
eukprot:648747-Hanusia_phi.AAC.3